MKKNFSIIILIVVVLALYAAWNIFGPTVSAPEKKYLFIKTGAAYADVKKQLLSEKIISNGFFFDRVAGQAKYTNNVKAGRYEIKNGSSVIRLVSMLKSGRQAPVRLVINKLRTKEDLAKLIAKNFASDSMTVLNFLNNNDSLKQFGVDSNTVFSMILPNTYSFYYFTPINKIFTKSADKKNVFLFRKVK